MQLTLNLELPPVLPAKKIISNDLWIDVSPEARMIGFIQKVKASIALSDALQPFQTEDDDAYNQRLYDAIWLAHHYSCLDQQPSISFTFTFLSEDLTTGKITEASLRLHLEIREGTALLGLLGDF